MKYGGNKTSKPWSINDIWLLRSNWKILSNTQIGDKLDRSSKAVSLKGTALDLGKKKCGAIHKEFSNKAIATADYHRYLEMCNLNARMKEFRSNFDLTGIHKFIVNDFDLRGNRVKDERKINGKVVSTTQNIVTLQLEHYKESFAVNSFFTGEISIRS